MRVLCILTDGYEELEAVGTIALLRRAGIDMDISAVSAKEACGRFHITMSNLLDLDTIDPNAYDVLFFPISLILRKGKKFVTIISHIPVNNKKKIIYLPQTKPFST